MTQGMAPDAPPSPVRVAGAAAAALAAVAACGQAFVVLREVYTAARTGASIEFDALVVALVVPSIAVGLLSSGTQAALVPAFLEAQAARGIEAARVLTGTIVVAVLGIAFLIAILVGVLAEAAVSVSGPGLSLPSRQVAASFMPALLPLIVLAPAGTLLAAICQVHGMFRTISVSWVAGPVVALLVTLLLWGSLGVGALAVAITADAAATALVLVVALFISGHLPRLSTSIPSAELAAFARHAVPLAAGTSVLSLNLLADRAVASLLAAGSVSALQYGERIVRAPISILMPAWSTVIYPAIARTAVGEDRSAMGRSAAEALRFVFASFLPLCLATAALAPWIVAVAYERGAFDRAATLETAKVLAALSPLVLLWLVNPIVNGAHNARRRGGLLARNAALNALLNVVLNLGLGLPFGVAGVALSTSVTGWVLNVHLLRRLRDMEPDFDLAGVAGVAWRSLIASLVPALPLAVVVWVVRPQLDLAGHLVLIVAATLAGTAMYLGAARLLGLREPGIAAGALRRKAALLLGRRI